YDSATSRKPLSYRRITKNQQAGFKFFQIVALQRCHCGAAIPIINELSDFLARFQHFITQIGLYAKSQFPEFSFRALRADRKNFALNISRHQRTRFLASEFVNHGARCCKSLVMAAIFLRVV
ncbi:hypothetical protein GP939_33030, partial [Escherichia coli]|nr:hypothetical protein [Escherichia coli]